MQSQLNDLIDEVDELKIRESMYKQQMEKKTCDLQKAETEVSFYCSSIFNRSQNASLSPIFTMTCNRVSELFPFFSHLVE